MPLTSQDEQKTAKLIALIEELRRDLPNVKNRHDPQAVAMEQATDPQAILSAMEEPGQEVTSLEHPDTPAPEAALSPTRQDNCSGADQPGRQRHHLMMDKDYAEMAYPSREEDAKPYGQK